ncbi:MAG: MFS transporter [Candidatus Doudnabacteria bacterium]|nr:MFS transporter [Candidatus Doudnabacteria bacterium]
MFLKFRLPHYFTTKLRTEVKELYVATAIADLALATMLIFEPIFLYQSVGFSVPKILLFFAAVYAWYVVLIPIGAKFAARFGFKHSLIASVPFQLLYWACLYFALEYPQLVWVAAFLYGLEKSFYWPAFHSVVAQFANQGQVAREFSFLTALIQLAQILGPVAGGFIAQVAGGQNLLIVAGAIYSLAIIPLFFHKEKGSKKPYRFADTLRLYKVHVYKMLGYWGFGEELLALTIWPIFMFIAVQGYGATGGAVTLAAAISAIISLYMGKWTDTHPKRPLIKLGGLMTAVTWLVRPWFPSPQGVTSVDTGARVAKNVSFIPICTVTYERAEASSIVPYVVFFEQSLAIGKLLTALAAAALFYMFASYSVLFILGALVSLLYVLL